MNAIRDALISTPPCMVFAPRLARTCRYMRALEYAATPRGEDISAPDLGYGMYRHTFTRQINNSYYYVEHLGGTQDINFQSIEYSREVADTADRWAKTGHRRHLMQMLLIA